MKKLMLKMGICSILIVFAILAFASKGGGGDKKAANSFKNNFTPIHALSSFTLKKAPVYSGSYVYNQEKENKRLSFNTMITYENGNTIYILPYKYKVSVSNLDNAPKTNLQLLGVKIKMPK